jgi:H+/Cl- antiporter ClcA
MAGKKKVKDGHERHYLPTIAVWGTTIVIAFTAAITNFSMVWLDVKLVIWKFDTVQKVMSDSSVGLGVLTLVGISVLYSGVATCLVCLVAPVCAGSGLPEMKGYLNGNHIKGMWQVRAFFVRVLGIIFSTGSGFPAGREGPMVCIGGLIGYRVIDCCRSIPQLRKFLNIYVPNHDEDWFREARRVGSTLGGAAGVATAFNAPLGGILYMLEEATVTSWAPETTFSAFVCTGCGAIFSRGLLNAGGGDFHRLVIFEPKDDTASHISWEFIDVPFFMILAAFVGSCSAAFTHVLIFVWKTRRKIDAKLKKFQPYAKMVGAVLYAALCAVILSLVPLAFDCVTSPVEDPHHRRLGGGASLVFVQYDCPEGQHNVLATLLLNPGEAAAKHLVSRSGAFLSCGPLAVAVVIYGTLAMGMPGLAVPMGNFIPAMVIGSLFGRLFGEALHESDSLHSDLTHPGVYAMVGSAAMLGGFTHMTIAIVALLTEAGHDISLVPPLMLSIFVAHLFSHYLNHIGYDERLILLKGVPFIEPDMPDELDTPDALAKFLCNKMPDEARLAPQIAPERAKGALDSDVAIGFPILGEDGTCLGTVTRARLSAAVANIKSDEPKLDLKGYMNTTPFRVLEDMPAARFYPLFAKGITNMVCVVDKEGKFSGMLSRASVETAVEYRHGHEEEVRKAILEKDDIPQELKTCTPHSHHIPGWLTWTMTILIGVCVAMTNFAMVWVDVKLVTWKFEKVQDVMTESGVGVGLLVLAGFALLYAGIATCMVCLLAPICAGSGLPEAKGYLNGNPIPKMFEWPAFIVRVLGIILSTAAGYPAGREGPMVCIGGFIGEKVTHMLILPYVRAWVKLDSDADHFSPTALLVDEERFSEAKRIGSALGGAAGVATAFNAPIGGILYMFEEVGVTSWAPELTFRALIIAACGAFMSRGLLNVTKADFHRLVIFQDSAQASISWDWIDVPFFILLAAFVGSCAAGFTRILLVVWQSRRRMHSKLKSYQPYAKIIECLLYVVLCSMCFCLIPLLFDCVSNDYGGGHGSSSGSGSSASHGSSRLLSDSHYSHTRRLGGGASLVFVQFDCPTGEHNTLATLLLNGGESIVKHLVSRSGAFLKLGPLAVATIVYTLLAMGMPGLAVPMGNFIPSMVIGSLIGRFVGEVLMEIDSFRGEIASPGVYAMIGSAAMLGGFTHMTVAIVALLTEAGHDITLISPLMLSVFVAHFFSKIGNHHGYDEVLIILKGVPFIDAEVPHELEDLEFTTADLCENFPSEGVFEPAPRKQQVQDVLAKHDSPAFPVVRAMGGAVIGLVSAHRLKVVAPARASMVLTGAYGHDVSEEQEAFLGEEDEELHLDDVFKQMVYTRADSLDCTSSQNVADQGRDSVDLRHLMDPVPFRILEDMPATVTYALFARGVVSVALVVTKDGKFCGALFRHNFMHDYISKLSVRDSDSRVSPIGDDSARRQDTPPGDDLRATAAKSESSKVPEQPPATVVAVAREANGAADFNVPAQAVVDKAALDASTPSIAMPGEVPVNSSALESSDPVASVGASDVIRVE